MIALIKKKKDKAIWVKIIEDNVKYEHKSIIWHKHKWNIGKPKLAKWKKCITINLDKQVCLKTETIYQNYSFYIPEIIRKYNFKNYH